MGCRRVRGDDDMRTRRVTVRLSSNRCLAGRARLRSRCGRRVPASEASACRARRRCATPRFHTKGHLGNQRLPEHRTAYADRLGRRATEPTIVALAGRSLPRPIAVTDFGVAHPVQTVVGRQDTCRASMRDGRWDCQSRLAPEVSFRTTRSVNRASASRCHSRSPDLHHRSCRAT